MTARDPNRPDDRPAWFAKMRECDGKDQLKEQEAKNRAASIKRREKRSEVEAYQCKHCGHWHIGHARRDR